MTFSESRRRLLVLVAAGTLPVGVLAAESPLSLPADFDPARDPARDLDSALKIAHAAGRRVLIEVGGEWCSWCHILDRFFEANPDLRRYRDANYVWLKVNWSPENTNQAFLRRYPAIDGYPHMFVLDASRPPAAFAKHARARAEEGLRPRRDARLPRQVGAEALASTRRCRARAQATCSRTSGDGSPARVSSAATIAGSCGALPSATARLRSQRS